MWELKTNAESRVRLNDDDREDWINNDGYLYRAYTASGQAMESFIEANRSAIDAHVESVLSRLRETVAMTSQGSGPPTNAMLFELGRVIGTPDAVDHLAEYGCSPLVLITRHLTGDWGDLCEHDGVVNCQAIINGGRIFSMYVVGDQKVYVITEADRSCTTVLLSSEY